MTPVQKTKLFDLAARAGIHVGNRVDTRLLLEYEHEANVRTITSVHIRYEYGKDWLIWRWTPFGGRDCGYSGHAIDEELLERLEALAGSVRMA